MERREKPPPPKGRVVTFYSYKGGTGRSMAVANVAWILALSGERVLIVDWDLEAPGIHRYFHPFLDDKDLLATEGLLDFVEKLAGRAAVSSGHLSEEDVDVVEYITMLKWPANFSLSWEKFGPRSRIDLLVAGRQGPGYSRKLNAFNWIDFYERLGGRRLLSLAREQMCGLYDYILIDSRTGVSDTSGICTVEMPDTLVVCFTLNDQSIMGASGVAESVMAQRATLPQSELSPPRVPFRIFPVPTRVEIVSERVKREVALNFAQQKFARFLEHIPSKTKYWGSVQLPYFPFYAFEEIPAVFGDPANEKLALLTPMKDIARTVSGNTSLDLASLADDEIEAERLRKEILGWYVRKADSVALDPVQLTQATYDQLDRAGQAQMRELMLRLVRVTPGEAPSPATIARGEIAKQIDYLVEILLSTGIIQSSGTSCFIGERKIVESWDLLRQWVKEEEPFLLWRQNVAVMASSWENAGRDSSALLLGRFLDESLKWMKTHSDQLNETEQSFINASKDKKARESYSLKITLPLVPFLEIAIPARQLTFVALVVLAGLVGYLINILNRPNRAQDARGPAIISMARELAKGDPLVAALLLTELPDFAASETDRKFALDIATNALPYAVLRGKYPYRSIEFARDGKMLVMATDGGAEIWNAETWRKTRDLGNFGVGLVSASFNGWVPERAKLRGSSGKIDRVVTMSKNGQLQTISLDGSSLMSLDVSNLSTSYFENCPNRIAQAKGPVYKWAQRPLPNYARFAPDEAVLMLAYPNGSIVMVSPQNGSCFDVYAPKSDYSAQFSPDGKSAGTMSPEGAARGLTDVLTLFHVQDWKQTRYAIEFPTLARVTPVAISSKIVLLRNLLELFAMDLGTKQKIHIDFPLFGTVVGAVVGALSADSKLLAIAGWNDAWWGALNSKSNQTLTGHSSAITGISFDRAGNYILTASEDKTVRVWSTNWRRPGPLSSWKEIVSHLRGSTRECLTADKRSELLDENSGAAQQAAKNCESQNR